MAFNWPETLPQKILRSGFAPGLASNTLRQKMEYGPDKIRKRKAPAYRPMQAEATMTITQLGLLLVFYETTLQQGSIPFDWLDPIFGTPLTFRFVEPPMWMPYGFRVKVTLNLEMAVPLELLRTVRGSD